MSLPTVYVLLASIRIAPGLVDEDEEVQAVTDRTYWEARTSKPYLAMADEMLEVVRVLDQLERKYTKFPFGLAHNVVSLEPRRDLQRPK